MQQARLFLIIVTVAGLSTALNITSPYIGELDNANIGYFYPNQSLSIPLDRVTYGYNLTYEVLSGPLTGAVGLQSSLTELYKDLLLIPEELSSISIPKTMTGEFNYSANVSVLTASKHLLVGVFPTAARPLDEITNITYTTESNLTCLDLVQTLNGSIVILCVSSIDTQLRIYTLPDPNSKLVVAQKLEIGMVNLINSVRYFPYDHQHYLLMIQNVSTYMLLSPAKSNHYIMVPLHDTTVTMIQQIGMYLHLAIPEDHSILKVYRMLISDSDDSVQLLFFEEYQGGILTSAIDFIIDGYYYHYDEQLKELDAVLRLFVLLHNYTLVQYELRAGSSPGMIVAACEVPSLIEYTQIIKALELKTTRDFILVRVATNQSNHLAFSVSEKWA